jgi:hypothetical protein
MPFLEGVGSLVSYQLTEVRSIKDLTEAVILKGHLFNKYVSVNSPFHHADWEKIKVNIFTELGLVNASSMLKQHILSLLDVKEVNKGSMVLRQDQVPAHIMFLALGQVYLHSTLVKQDLRQGVQVAVTSPQKRTQAKQLKGEFGVLSGTLISLPGSSQMSTIGLEYPILNKSLPFTYVAASDLVLFTIETETFLRQLEKCSMANILALKTRLQTKMDSIKQISQAIEINNKQFKEDRVEKSHELMHPQSIK